MRCCATGAHAKDYVRMQWMMPWDQAEDFVIATGQQFSVRESLALDRAGTGHKPAFRRHGR
ncbi:MAG: GDP-mannose 4,6-dehydratase [Caenibius sp.]